MVDNYEEDEINLTSLFAELIRKAGIIILVCLLCTGLAVGYKVTYLNKVNDYGITNRQALEDEIAIHESRQKNLADSIDGIDAKIANEIEYQNKSLLSTFDEYGTYRIAKTYFINVSSILFAADSQTNSLQYATSKIESEYKAYWNSLDIYEDFHLYEDAEYSDLYNNDNNNRIFRELYGFSADNGVITIAAYGKDEEKAQQLLDYAEPTFDEMIKKLSENSYSHTLSLINAKTEIISINSTMRSRRNTLNELYAEWEKAAEEIESLEKDSPSSVKMSIIKFAVIGFIAGGFLSCGCIVVLYLFANKMNTSSMPNELCKIEFLGSLENKKKNLLEKLADDINHELRWDNLEEAEKYIKSKTNFLLKDNGAFITSTLEIDETTKQELAKLFPNIKVEENICKNAEAIDELNNADSVILIEKRRKASMEEIKKTVKFINSHNKKVLGYIVY